MANTPSYEQITERQYDTFIKKALINEQRNFFRALKRRMKREVLFCELGEERVNAFIDPSATEAFSDVEAEFNVLQYSVSVRNDLLNETLSLLDEQARNVILMFHWLDMTDQEISDETGFPRRTVNYVRNKGMLRAFILLSVG